MYEWRNILDDGNINERPKMKVYPVKFRWNDNSWGGFYYIVAESAEQAEDIAYKCIAANIHPQPERYERPAEDGRRVAKVWVRDSWACDTICDEVGLIGAGSPTYNAKAYAEYIKRTGKLH